MSPTSMSAASRQPMMLCQVWRACSSKPSSSLPSGVAPTCPEICTQRWLPDTSATWLYLLNGFTTPLGLRNLVILGPPLGGPQRHPRRLPNLIPDAICSHHEEQS